MPSLLFFQTAGTSFGDAIPWSVIVSVAVTVWGVLWAFARWAMPAKVREIVRETMQPEIASLKRTLEAKADTSDVVNMERRFEERTRPFLAGIEDSTTRTADGMDALNERIGMLAERLSRMEGAWDGMERRRTDRRTGGD
jgi:hypothetical protein